jgi:hypothetical protein
VPRPSRPTAHLQASLPHVQPTAQELADMNRRAAEVVRLLEEYRQLAHPEFEREPAEPVNASRSFEAARPPKRPWEDVAQDNVAGKESYRNVWNSQLFVTHIGILSSSFSILLRVTRPRQLQSKTWRSSEPNARRAPPVPPLPLANQRANIGRGV